MKNKKLYIIGGIFCTIFFAIGVTYAWLTWNSKENTNFAFRLGDVGEAIFVGGNEISVSGIGPVLSPLEGSATEFQILKKSYVSFTVTIDFLPTILPDILKDASFKYALYSKETESDTYSFVTEGNFLDKEAGTQFTILNDEITTTRYYKLFIYIDGNMENPLDMQGQNFEGKVIVTYGETLTVPTITTDITTVSATVGDTVDLLSGITALESDGTTVLTPSVTVNGTQVTNTSGSTTTIGLTNATNTVVYTVTSASGETATLTRTYTIKTKSVTQYRKGTESTTRTPSCGSCACGDTTCVGCAVCPWDGVSYSESTSCGSYGAWTTTYQSGSCVQTRTCTMQPNGSCS